MINQELRISPARPGRMRDKDAGVITIEVPGCRFRAESGGQGVNREAHFQCPGGVLLNPGDVRFPRMKSFSALRFMNGAQQFLSFGAA